jgi:uncharacterized protein
MLFAVIFKDKPQHGELRAQTLEAHAQWLDEMRETVLVAGSLCERPQDTPIGGLWLVEAPSKKAVKELLSSDPFFTCGLRQDVQILHWNKAFPARKVAV